MGSLVGSAPLYEFQGRPHTCPEWRTFASIFSISCDHRYVAACLVPCMWSTSLNGAAQGAGLQMSVGCLVWGAGCQTLASRWHRRGNCISMHALQQLCGLYARDEESKRGDLLRGLIVLILDTQRDHINVLLRAKAWASALAGLLKTIRVNFLLRSVGIVRFQPATREGASRA